MCIRDRSTWGQKSLFQDILEPNFKEMMLKPRANAEFEDTYDDILPTEGEVRVVASRNTSCKYYWVGIDVCRKKMALLASDPSNENHSKGFLPCKRLVDAHYRCMTDEQYGYTIEDVPKSAKPFADQFFTCAFKDLKNMQLCRRYFDGIVRTLYREPNTKINDNYQCPMHDQQL
eukprot:TRINITY_DN2196_c0_g1_i10.p1 TRINITY_DN2196_c0_g1~~TRINITY_DN2196_c0_g1_i10.p1  ORF type:complete len:174 (-),score=39.68 TRINITY_DN2196_c0_g1_i10:195-716(-)